MKAYKLEVLIFDFDDVGGNDIKEIIENTKYPNYCIRPHVKSIISADIGEWSDNHVIHKRGMDDIEYKKVFP